MSRTLPAVGGLLAALAVAGCATPPDQVSVPRAPATDTCRLLTSGPSPVVLVVRTGTAPQSGEITPPALMTFAPGRAPVLWSAALTAPADVAFLDADLRVFHTEPQVAPGDIFLSPESDLASAARHILVLPAGALENHVVPGAVTPVAMSEPGACPGAAA